ncbi:MAG TPA: S8 family serine peptidase [Thermoanaerobaculia bacterium]
MRFRVSIAVVVLVVSIPLFAADYVLVADGWNPSRSEAVAAAGGTVTYSHAATGIAVASSDDPAFADRLNGTGAFSIVAQDVHTRMQARTQVVELEESAVTPGNETFVHVQWVHRAVNAQAAWDAGYTGRGVRIAVLDGGIHDRHIDLRDRVDTALSKSFVPGQPYNADTGTFWHGTHVAGVIAASDNNIGAIGIAPEATLIAVKILHDGGGEFGWAIPGILYAADPISEGGAGADIINMSLEAHINRKGGGGPLVSAMAKAVNYAKSRGVLVISAAGNDALDLGQPEEPVDEHEGEEGEEGEEHEGEPEEPLHKSVVFLPAESGSGIAVSATGPVGYGFGATDFRRPAFYTNYGEGVVWVSAPGGDFSLEETPQGQQLCSFPRVPSGMTTQRCWIFDMILSSTRGSGASTGTYSYGAGTSMAAGVVSGVAALVKQAKPNATPAQLKTILARTADDEGRRGTDQFHGHGFVNAGRAVE